MKFLFEVETDLSFEQVRAALVSALGSRSSVSVVREASAVQIIAQALLGEQAMIEEDPHMIAISCPCGERVRFGLAADHRAIADALASHALTCGQSTLGQQRAEIVSIMNELAGVFRRRSMKGGGR